MVELKDNNMRILFRGVDEICDIIFGENLFPRIAHDLKDTQIGERYAIITDSNIRGLYAVSLESRLKGEGLGVTTFSFGAGEPNKTNENCMRIIGEMHQLKYGRDAAIVAIGGGVVGDMAGFIAAIFNRGIPYIQIPTTIVAQADSSIGGKTAVNTEYGKNLVGAFKQPKRVYIDIATLATLSDRDYRSGLAETIKHAVIQDAEFFRYLTENTDLMAQRNPEFLLHIAKNNCRIKGNVVEIDPHEEKGLRRILNYGHTIGHAIEKISVDRYERKEGRDYLRHGECVAMGMVVAGRIAKSFGFSVEDLERQEQLLLAVGLPTKIPSEISTKEIFEVTSVDKKGTKGRARYVLPVAIGRMHDFNGVYATHVDDGIVEAAIEETR